VRWPWQKREATSAFFDTVPGWNGPDQKIAWPTFESLRNFRPPDPEPEDVVPTEVYELVQEIEDRARRLRKAAEVHFMRRHVPGYHNRSWRRWNWGKVKDAIWETPVEYTTGIRRGIVGYITGADPAFTGAKR
jgi:hypothetical protein